MRIVSSIRNSLIEAKERKFELLSWEAMDQYANTAALDDGFENPPKELVTIWLCNAQLRCVENRTRLTKIYKNK